MAEDIPFLSPASAETLPSNRASTSEGNLHDSSESRASAVIRPINLRGSNFASLGDPSTIAAKAKPQRIVRIQTGLAGRNNERRFKAPDCAPPKANKEEKKGRRSIFALGFLANLKDGTEAAKKKAQSTTSNEGALWDIREITNTIYDGAYLKGSKVKKKILYMDGLFAVENDEEPSDILFRCFHDWRAKLADCIMLFTVACSLFISPLSFLWNGGWDDLFYVPGGTTLLVFDILLDLVYMSYMVLRLNTSFLHPTRRVEVVDRRKIVRHCLNITKTQGAFWWFSMLGSTMHFWIGLGLPMAFNWVKLSRLTHLVHLPDSLWRYHNMSKLRLSKPIMCLLVASHWIACLLSCVGGYSQYIKTRGSSAFETSVGDSSVSGWVSSYFMAYVEALYMLTGSLDNPLGLGEGPRNRDFGSLLVVSVFGPVGCVVIALFISNIVQTQSLVHALAIRHEENREYIKCALDNLNIPNELRRRVFSMHYFQLMGHDNEAFSHLFNKRSLNAPLESAIKVHLYMDSMLRSQYFINKDPNYILEVIRLLEDAVFLPGDYVTRRGEVGSQMFFVARGILSVFTPDPRSKGMIKVASKTIGDFFGEIAMVRDVVRTASVRADTYVLVSSLARDAIEFVWQYWPEEREHLRSRLYDESLQETYRARVAAQKWKKIDNSRSSLLSAREQALKRADTLAEELSVVAEDVEGKESKRFDATVSNASARSNALKRSPTLIEKAESLRERNGKTAVESADSLALSSRALKFTKHQQAAVDFLSSPDSATLSPEPRDKDTKTAGHCKCRDLLSIVSSLQNRVADALEQQAELENLIAASLQSESGADLEECMSPKYETVPPAKALGEQTPSSRKKRVLRRRDQPSSNADDSGSSRPSRTEASTFLEEDDERKGSIDLFPTGEAVPKATTFGESSSDSDHDALSDGGDEPRIGHPYFPSVAHAVTNASRVSDNRFSQRPEPDVYGQQGILDTE